MITVEYCRTMARYNAWQNRAMLDVMRSLKKGELTKDRGAFFGSIFATANHLLWADQFWMSRFDGGLGPNVAPQDHKKLHDTLDLFLSDRVRTDARISRWADGLTQVSLIGPMTWHSPTQGKEFTRTTSQCITQFFNHQTHHRGQIHAMLTAAGHKPGDTDLILMPDL